MAELIQFDGASGRRIANAVRAVEGLVPPAAPLTYSPILWPERRSGAFRLCTFTGAWSKNASKTLTLKYQTATPNTVTAINLFANIDMSGSGSRNCGIAKDGTAWFLIAAECD